MWSGIVLLQNQITLLPKRDCNRTQDLIPIPYRLDLTPIERKGENDRRKYFMINLHEKTLGGGWTRDLLVSSRTAHPTEPPRPAHFSGTRNYPTQNRSVAHLSMNLDIFGYILLGCIFEKMPLGHMRRSKSTIRLRIHAVWPGPSLFAYRFIACCSIWSCIAFIEDENARLLSNRDWPEVLLRFNSNIITKTII